MKNKILATLDNYHMIAPGMRICVCLSGGADSCALLHALYHLQNIKKFQLVACHYNHHIRQSESDRDEQFCIDLCYAYGIPLYTGGSNIPLLHPGSGQTLEEFSRNARYQWFESISRLYAIDRFATAHHKGDQAETVLFRLFRGTSPKGFTGISATRGRYIRPLIDTSKEEILQYIAEHNLSFVEDSTNSDTTYTRNFIRHVILPKAKEINPNAVDAVNRMANSIREDNELLESLLPAYSEKQYVANLHDALLRRIIYRNFLEKSKIVLGYKHLDKIFLKIKKQNNFRLQIDDLWTAVYAKGYLSFELRKNLCVLQDEGELCPGENLLCNNRVRMHYATQPCPSFHGKNRDNGINVYNLSTEMVLSSNKICGMIRYRMRKPGDRFFFKGHHRSIKKMLCDQKIPLDARAMLPILFDDEGILGVPFLGVTDRVYSLDQSNSVIIKIEIATDYV